ncbi:hypothetical protein F5883DRAFT_215368 [Diaporthe sp. PMI_573]|nr:hypothetical protein F5883DRAFT_215368 [Diaporthaceae sp. PMI_573]
MSRSSRSGRGRGRGRGSRFKVQGPTRSVGGQHHRIAIAIDNHHHRHLFHIPFKPRAQAGAAAVETKRDTHTRHTHSRHTTTHGALQTAQQLIELHLLLVLAAPTSWPRLWAIRYSSHPHITHTTTHHTLLTALILAFALAFASTLVHLFCSVYNFSVLSVSTALATGLGRRVHLHLRLRLHLHLHHPHPSLLPRALI